MQIPINKEIRHYQEEIFLGLNLRQMICISHDPPYWPVLWPLRRLQQQDFTYDCLTFEKFLLVVIDSTVIRNDWRLWKTETNIAKEKG